MARITLDRRIYGLGLRVSSPAGKLLAAGTCKQMMTACQRSGMQGYSSKQQLTITQPDDWHVHFRQQERLSLTVPLTSQQFRRAVIMPNLVPPITSAKQALNYKQEILQHVPDGTSFQPLMTLYLTDDTTAEDVAAAKDAGIIAYKLYPAGATTNSASGVTNPTKCLSALQAMSKAGLPLLIHGEVTDPSVDFFDRERVFIERILRPVMDSVPDLRVVLEHITTADAAEFVQNGPDHLGATITPQHMLFNRNSLFVGGLRPHLFCLPILKRERHREAVLAAATSGSPKFFLGTDSAPHAQTDKECACGCAGVFSAPVAMEAYAMAFESVGALDKLEGFASFHGPDFYGLPRNNSTLTLLKEEKTVPNSCLLGSRAAAGSSATLKVIPLFAGQTIPWQVQTSQ
ncbi:hypothetical protein WJX74_006207 [Apatococcus lobatus]|uniref:dihydroorotase n=1 Tax=Apatococcus lobatus TaxID=904363 RepID=A0AAW1S2D2_9CHLO